MTDFPHNKIGTLLRQSALLVLWLNCPEQFLRGLFLPGEFFLLPAGGLGFLHAVKFLGGVFQTQVSVGIERYADVAVTHQVL